MDNKAFTFICGEDDFLANQQGRRIFEEWGEGISDRLSCEIISGISNNVSEVETIVSRFNEAVLTLSLFSKRKVVWLKDVNFLADSQTGRAEGTKKQLEVLQNTLESINPAMVRVVITAFPVDRRRKEFKWLQSHADYLYIESSSPKMLTEIVQNECQKQNVQIDEGTLLLLLTRLNSNARLVVEEIRKLITYLGANGGTINEKLVVELVPNFGENDFFEVAEAFYALDLDWTLNALRQHFFSHKEARPLITTLQNRNRLVIQLRMLIDAGELSLKSRGIRKSTLETVAQKYAHYFGEVREKSSLNIFTQNPWYLSRLSQVASKLTLRKLIDFQLAFMKAFEAILSRPTEQESILRHLAFKCLG